MTMVGQLDTVQLPGEQWLVIPTTRIWSWGGIDEKTIEADPICAPGTPETITWRTVCALVEAAPFQRGYIGALKIADGRVWWDGWKSLTEAALLPEAVLSVSRRIVDGSETISATVLAERAA